MRGESVDLSPIIQEFQDFFNANYKEDMYFLVSNYPEKKSLVVDYKLLEKYNADLADQLIENPDDILYAAKNALLEMNLAVSPEVIFKPNIRFFNLPESNLMIESIGSKHISRLINVKGIITKRAEVKHRVHVAEYKCSYCGNVEKVVVDSNSVVPTMCSSCKRKGGLALAEESSAFVDVQRAEMQELLERLKGGTPPAHIELWMEDDLVNSITPGDTIEVTGILRIRRPSIPRGKPKHAFIYTRFLDVIHTQTQRRDFEEIEITEEDEEEISELSKDQRLYTRFVKSVVPSIYGHNEIKEAALLQMFGGTKDKKTIGNAKIRDDIHILLIGDPGVAKTRLLRYMSSLAPKSVYVSGKTVSGVGLCVDKDSLIILNNKGIVRIGEYIEEKFGSAIEELPGAFSSKNDISVVSISKNMKTSFKNSGKIWKIKSPKKVVQIKTRRGKSLVLTPNTPLIVFDGGKLKWVKGKDIMVGDRIATSRRIPTFKERSIPVISLLNYDNIYVGDVSQIVKDMTNKLKDKYGCLQKIAEHYSITRDLLYTWRYKQKSSVKLNTLKNMALEADISIDELSEYTSTLFVRYGEEIKIPRYINQDLTYFAGLIAGDGDISVGENGESAGVRFHSSDGTQIKKMDKLVRKLFSISPQIVLGEERVPNVRMSSIIVADILMELGIPSGRKSSKIDPSEILVSSGNSCLKSFVRGLFDCDGSAVVQKPNRLRIEYVTTSEVLAKKLQLILESWGIQSKLRARDKRGAYILKKGKKPIITKQIQYYLEILDAENQRKFRDEIGFSIPRKKQIISKFLRQDKVSNSNVDTIPAHKILKKIKEKYSLSRNYIHPQYCGSGKAIGRAALHKLYGKLARLGNINKEHLDILRFLSISDIYWDEIKSVKFRKPTEDYVYDITVNDSHTFLANGIFVHNTASAERDELADGGWTLKAGALVLASGGMASVDEFDKISEDDRGAMHEVMESGQISIAKAGIVATMRAKTAILAAANPKFGRFDPNRPPAEQFNIVPTMLSRFDLIFPMMDVVDEKKDADLATRILKTHRDAAFDETPEIDPDLLDGDLIKKYIAYARQNIRPVITEEAQDKIKEYYLKMRKMGEQFGAVAITPRQIEGLVRLTEASAKVRLSNVAEGEDANRAIRLVDWMMRKIGVDKETGGFDIDILATGRPKSQVDKINTIIDVVKEMQKQYDTVEIKKVLEEATTNYGIDKRTASRLIDELIYRGELYKTAPGHVKIVEQY